MGLFSQTTVLWGAEITQRIASIHKKRIFIVCDHFLKNTALLNEYLAALKAKNTVTLYTDVVPDPPLAKVIAGTKVYEKAQPDLLIAIGGGSAIDSAKAIYYFGQQANLVPAHDLIAIPTTSGTGSEVSSVAVITDTEANSKYPIVDDRIRPTEAWLDARFVASCPPKVTAFSGLDALTHALESLVATNASQFSMALSLQATRLIFDYLPKCFHDNDLAARKQMHQASCMAGLAFQNAGLGLSHSISHQMGGQFHLPHGLLNAMLLPRVISFNCRDKNSLQKYADCARTLGLATLQTPNKEAVDMLQQAIALLTEEVKSNVTLSEMGITQAQLIQVIPDMIGKTVKDFTYDGNPVKPTTEDLVRLMLSIY